MHYCRCFRQCYPSKRSQKRSQKYVLELIIKLFAFLKHLPRKPLILLGFLRHWGISWDIPDLCSTPFGTQRSQVQILSHRLLTKRPETLRKSRFPVFFILKNNFTYSGILSGLERFYANASEPFVLCGLSPGALIENCI